MTLGRESMRERYNNNKKNKTRQKKTRKIMNTQNNIENFILGWVIRMEVNPLAPPPFRLIAHTHTHTPVPCSFALALGSYRRCALSTAGWLTPNGDVSTPLHPPPQIQREGRGIGSMRGLSGGGGCKMSTIASRQKGQAMRSREWKWWHTPRVSIRWKSVFLYHLDAIFFIDPEIKKREIRSTNPNWAHSPLRAQ